MPDDPDEGSDMTMEDIEESFSASEIEATMRRIETEIKEESAIDSQRRIDTRIRVRSDDARLWCGPSGDSPHC